MSKRQNKTYLWVYALSVLIVVFTALFTFAPRQEVHADPGEPGPFNRLLNYGFFWNGRFTRGLSVIGGGVNALDVNTLITDIRSRAENWCGCQSLQNIRGAQFIIKTMIRNTPNPNALPTTAEIDKWQASVYGLLSSGGSINFNAPIFFNVNSYWQSPGPAAGDDAFYTINHGAYVWNPFGFDPDGVFVGNSIAFYDRFGNQVYAIRRACGNPVGQLPGLPDPVPYNVIPTINVTVNGALPPAGAAEAGDTIAFDYRLINTTTTASPGVFCSQYGNVHTGFYQHPDPNTPEPGGTPGFTFCPQTVPGNGNIQVRPVESVVAAANTTVCRMLYVWPASPAGETKGYEVCVAVGSKPYLKIYGGDVSVGGGLAGAGGTCPSSNSGAVSWNKKTAGHPGAGTQFAALVLGLIREFATAQGSPGAAPVGDGLAFANTTTNPGAGQYGGSFGTVSCIKDHYTYTGGAPATPNNVSSFNPATPIYATAGNMTLGAGNINPNQRTTVFIDGNLYITGPTISYLGSWNPGSIPMFKVVVRGNIYIDNDVTRLDGIYIAQKKTGVPASGTIYTCTTSAAVPSVSAGNFYGNCTNKLTVNGAFIADSVEFLRTAGTQRGSTANEANTSSNIAEVFNYGPAFWMQQPAPPPGTNVDNYDAITSLPPVL